MAFNMALSWKWPQHVPTFHCSLYFFHLLFSKKHLVLIVFFMFCPVSVLVGWLQQLLFYSKGADISHTPRIISSLVETPQNGIQHGSFLEVAPTCPNLSLFPLFLPSSFQQEAFGSHCFFHVLSCFCAGWVVAARQQNIYSNGSGHLFFFRFFFQVSPISFLYLNLS